MLLFIKHNRRHHHKSFEILRVVYISLQINKLLCYTDVSVLVLGIGIARRQYYWILGALFGIVLTLQMTDSHLASVSFYRVMHCGLVIACHPSVCAMCRADTRTCIQRSLMFDSNLNTPYTVDTSVPGLFCINTNNCKNVTIMDSYVSLFVLHQYKQL